MRFIPIEIDSKHFSYERLIDNGNEHLLKRFEAIKGADWITDYFKRQALKDEKDFLVRNYVVKIKGTEVLIACFTLKCGSIVKHITQEVGLKVLYLFAANQKLAGYYKTWGFYAVDDEAFNEQLNDNWQNEYSQNCIFMYKPVAEIE